MAWQDVNLEEQCLTIRRCIRYDGSKRKYIIGPTKRKKVRIVDCGETLVEIFRNARKEQLKNRMQYGELYHTNYYKMCIRDRISVSVVQWEMYVEVKVTDTGRGISESNQAAIDVYKRQALSMTFHT